jgi:phosphatidylglycerophosphate synthase
MEQEIHHTINKKVYRDSLLSGKIHWSLEDPLSQFFYDLSDKISPTLYNLGITPNIVTLTRFFLIIVGFLYFFQNGDYRLSAICYIVSYFGDCLDGHLSRKYGLDTEFGDYFDHFSDILSVMISIYFIYISLDEKYTWLLILMAISLFMGLVHISCEERYLDMIEMNRKSESLEHINCLCSKSLISDDELEGVMEVGRFFGFGTYQLFVTILLWNFAYLAK